MEVALKEAENLDKTKFEMMANMANAYNTNRKCPVQEAAYKENFSELFTFTRQKL